MKNQRSMDRFKGLRLTSPQKIKGGEVQSGDVGWKTEDEPPLYLHEWRQGR